MERTEQSIGNGVNAKKEREDNPVRIAMVQHRDADDVRSWSGTLYFTKDVLSRHVGEIIDLTPAPFSLTPYKVAAHLVRRLTGKMAHYEHDVAFAKRLGAAFSRKLRSVDADLVYSPAGSASLAFLETDVPTIHFSDATWRVITDYYSYYSNLPRRTEEGGELIERRSLEQAAIVMVHTDWAARSVIDDYGIPPERVRVMYMGASLMNPPEREAVLPKSLGDPVRFLLVGVDWYVKGGDIAVQVVKGLREKGINATLRVVGCRKPEEVDYPWLESIPFLNKQIPEEREMFERFWHEADFFILPSRFEAAGMVLCEASAHALPSLAARTGGIPSLIVDGENGYTIPFDREPEGYIEIVSEIIADPERYRRLCESTRDAYEERMNWESWGTRFAREVIATFPDLAPRINSHRIGFGLDPV